MGYLLDMIHSRIERRPDVLESVLWILRARSYLAQYWLDLLQVRLRQRQCNKFYNIYQLVA